MPKIKTYGRKENTFDFVIDGDYPAKGLSKQSLGKLIKYIGQLESIGGTHETLTNAKKEVRRVIETK